MTELPSPYPLLTTLLPLLFTQTPSHLPPTLLSTPLSLSHRYLQPTPLDSKYLQLLPSPALTNLYHHLIESGAGEGQVELGTPGWNVEEGEGIKVRFPIGEDEGQGRVAVVLKWEEPTFGSGMAAHSKADEEPDPRPCWTFHTLALVTKESEGKPPLYHASMHDAIDHQQMEEQQRELKNIRPAGANGNGSMAIDIPKGANKGKQVEDMAEGEGTTPGAYGNSEDFWSGWGDEEGDEADAGAGGGLGGEEQEEGDYWERYGEVESLVGEEDAATADDLQLEEGDLVEDELRGRDGERPLVRSRRSSTIRATAKPAEGETTPKSKPSSTAPSRSGSPVPLPTLPAFPPLPETSYLSPALDPAVTSTATAPLPVPSPLLIPIPNHVNGVTGPGANGHVNADGKEVALSDSDEGLRFALAGVWALYAGNAKGDERDAKMDKWRRIGEMVLRS
ncbi:hypothetical protein MNV49_007751 [Pseudohyphozyma bogoriensis]|nr:hypothetical protein MNV49_007751 [Pseudohyphozyma bogoriensis]